MDPVLIILSIVTFFILVVYLRLNRAKIRGKYGETKVSLILKSLPENYHSFNNIYLRQGNKSVQIDHVVISVYGIFVIETKNYTGWIYGSDKSKQWVKSMYGHKYYFQNPLKQNYSHVRALQDAFALPIGKFVPVIVFLRGAILKCNTQGFVIYSSQLKRLIYSYTTPIINESEIEGLIDLLNSINIAGKGIRKKHIENINQHICQTRDAINNGICPKCGGRLVQRQGRYGSFLGCTNYPYCKYTT